MSDINVEALELLQRIRACDVAFGEKLRSGEIRFNAPDEDGSLLAAQLERLADDIALTDRAIAAFGG